MAASRRVRWECPSGEHPAVLGSTRPRKNAVVRFCIPCSMEAGVLVERRAPALERGRVAKQAARGAKQQREREQAREAAARACVVSVLPIAGYPSTDTIELDLRALLREAWATRAMRDARQDWTGGRRRGVWAAHAVPELTVRRGSARAVRAQVRRPERERDRTSGHAKVGENEIVLTIGPGCGEEWARAVVVHEAAHQAVEPGESHSHRWQRVYIAAMRELYGVAPARVGELSNWRLDEWIARALLNEWRGQ